MLRRAPAPLVALAALALALGSAPAAPAAEQRPPKVSAASAIVMEAGTGEVLYGRAAEKRRAIASATKLMTAVLTMERTRLSDKVTASSSRRAA